MYIEINRVACTLVDGVEVIDDIRYTLREKPPQYDDEGIDINTDFSEKPARLRLDISGVNIHAREFVTKPDTDQLRAWIVAKDFEGAMPVVEKVREADLRKVYHVRS